MLSKMFGTAGSLRVVRFGWRVWGWVGYGTGRSGEDPGVLRDGPVVGLRVLDGDDAFEHGGGGLGLA